MVLDVLGQHVVLAKLADEDAYRQEDSVPEIIDRSGVLGGRIPWYPGRDPQRNPNRLAS